MICRSCRKEVDDKATKCPYCRSAVGTAAMLQGIGGLVTLIVLGWLAYTIWFAPKSDAEVERPGAPAIRIQAADLESAYLENEVRADSDFKGRRVELLGKVEKVGVDIAGSPYILLAGSGLGVQATFSKDGAAALSSLHKGESVFLKCTCRGKLIFVQVDGCSF
jgi:hypothetical protein